MSGGVAAVVVKNRAILLVKEASGPHAGLWGLPKGTVEQNELPSQAVLRELKEFSIVNDASDLGIQGLKQHKMKLRPFDYNTVFTVSIKS